MPAVAMREGQPQEGFMCGWHLIKSWSSTQTIIAPSSGEAKYYSMVKDGSIALGCQARLQDLGIKMKFKCDASIVVASVLRKGLGRVRHIDVSQLWLHEKFPREFPCGQGQDQWEYT